MPLTYWKLIQDSDFDKGIAVYRRPKASPATESWVWQDDAACGGVSHKLFEPTFYPNLGKAKTIKKNEERFKQARKVCASCPVFSQCYLNSSDDDFFYTFRAGVEPVQFTEYKKLNGRVRYRTNQDRATCKRGHDDWIIWSGRKKCKSCDALGKKGRDEWDRMYAWNTSATPSTSPTPPAPAPGTSPA